MARSDWKPQVRPNNSHDTPPDSPASDDAADVVEPEAERTPQRAMADAIGQHESAPRDARWAGSAEATISGVIGKAGGEHVLKSIDCRTNTCVATLEWPSYDKAREQFFNILQAKYEPNCGVSLLVRDGTGAADVHFDCEETIEN